MSGRNYNHAQVTEYWQYVWDRDSAYELDISESTVGTYRTQATERLDEQVKVIRRMLRQQQADQQEEGIKEIAREAVETLRDCGVEVEFEIEPETDQGTDASANGTTLLSNRNRACQRKRLTGFKQGPVEGAHAPREWRLV
jgi:hypothetical protein